MYTTDISGIQLQLDVINLKNLQDLLQLGEVLNAKVLDVNQNGVTINLKGNIIKAFSNTQLEQNSTVKLLVTKLEPFVELKILNVDSKQASNLKNINLIAEELFSNVAKSELESVDSKTFATYIKTSYETLSNAFSNNNINLNENVFVAIPYYIDGRKFTFYIKNEKKFTKQKKQRQILTVFSETPIGFLKINLIKFESLWCNISVYEKNAYDLLTANKKELEDYVKIPIKFILKQNKPTIEMIKKISYIDVKI